MNATQDPKDMVAGFLAICLGLGFLLLTCVAGWLALTDSDELSAGWVNVLIGIAGGIVAIVGTYVGFRFSAAPREPLETDSGFLAVGDRPQAVISSESPLADPEDPVPDSRLL